MKSGYTLVELLVVMAIMAIMTVVAFTNLKSFREDTNLNKAITDLKGNLLTAQTNATTNLNCGNNNTITWVAELSKELSENSSQYILKIYCQYNLASVPTRVDLKSIPFDSGMNIDRICVGDVNCQPTSNCKISLAGSTTATIFFAPLSGLVSFQSTDPSVNSCFGSGSTLTVLVRDQNTNSTNCDVGNNSNLPAGCSTLNIGKGGSINVK